MCIVQFQVCTKQIFRLLVRSHDSDSRQRPVSVTYMDGCQDCRSVCLQDMIPCRPRKFSLAGQTYLIEGVFSRIIILIFPGRNFPEVSKG